MCMHRLKKGEAEGASITAESTIYSARMNTSIKATKKLTFQVFGMYKGASTNLQFETKAFYFVNAGARYSFLENKGMFSINFNDIFHTQQFSFDATRPIRQNGKFTWDSQAVYVGLSYRFGGGKTKK